MTGTREIALPSGIFVSSIVIGPFSTSPVTSYDGARRPLRWPSCQPCRADDNLLFVWAFAHFFVCWLARWVAALGRRNLLLRQSRTAVGRCECPLIGHGAWIGTRPDGVDSG